MFRNKNIQENDIFLKKTKYDKLIHENINSISGFSFPFSTEITKETIDGNYIISTGSYPSQVKCFSLENLNLKFQRNFDSDITDFQILSSDWEKIVFLRSDKRLDFHTKSGSYYQIKIPKKGVDLTFNRTKLFLYIPSIHNYVSVFDLNEGKFLNEIQLKEDTEITCSGISHFNGLIALGTKNGRTEFWDPRALKKPIGEIDSFKYKKYKKKNGVSTLKFSDMSEHLFFSGFNSGEIVVYDLRCFSPVISKIVERFKPIKSIRASYDSKFLLVSNSNSLKYWRLSTGKTKFSLNSEININHICSIKNSGMIFFSLNSKNIGIKYFKTLGPIPEWAKIILK